MNTIFTKLITFAVNLQLFTAGAGVKVNTTTNAVNAYTAAVVDSTNTMDGELKTFYDTELLENARVELYYAQFAKKQPLPAGRGKTVEWRKWNTFARADVLQEAIIPTGQRFGMSVYTDSIQHYGTYATISDELELHAYDDVILGATEEMGASAAETQEVLIRDALLENTNILYCDNLDADGKYKSTPTKPYEMGASSTNGYAYLTPDMVAKAVTKLKKDRVPTINGKYVMVIHPSCAYDLRKSDDWNSYHQYAATTQIFTGEIGELHGMRFVEDVFCPVLGASYQFDSTHTYVNKDGGKTYACYCFGKDAFGIIDPEGGALQMIVHSKSEIGGPLDQFSTIGYRFATNGAKVLYPERVLNVLCTSSYSGTDAEN